MTVSLLDRNVHQCCAPVGDGRGAAMQVCGEPVKPGSSYCPAHHRQFWIPLTPVALALLREEAKGTRPQIRALSGAVADALLLDAVD